ncbi:hypothetical protein ACFYQ5_35075 [Streptomyces sp. NPDC005794]|uniref:hypothetical protein n=1 Tax=Streptomyces sp. NPDC005794 TaxID=3364733 RepID=UPI0036A05D44
MGLVLFPGDDDLTSPDISWSYTGLNMFRQWLASVEGFTLSEMNGFDETARGAALHTAGTTTRSSG